MLSSHIEDVAVSGITTVNATISWTISRFTTSEVYYIQYGTDEAMQDMTSAYISSPMDTSLVNQTYSISLQDLCPSTKYYLRVVAVFDIISTRYSETISFITYDQGYSCAKKYLLHVDFLPLDIFLSLPHRTSDLPAIPQS